MTDMAIPTAMTEVITMVAIMTVATPTVAIPTVATTTDPAACVFARRMPGR